jgi:hypothetical protein
MTTFPAVTLVSGHSPSPKRDVSEIAMTNSQGK